MVTDTIATIRYFMDLISNFCYENAQCNADDEFCNYLQFQWPCIKDSQCYSDRCVDTTRVCAAKLAEGALCVADKECVDGLVCGRRCSKPCTEGCDDDEWCNSISYSPAICRPKRENDWGPCIADAQCELDRCVDTTRVCKPKKSDGSGCVADKECSCGNCEWFTCCP